MIKRFFIILLSTVHLLPCALESFRPISMDAYGEQHPYAGVIPYYKDMVKKQVYLLFAFDKNGMYWGDFGGEAEDDDLTSLDTAVRELDEESAKKVTIDYDQLLTDCKKQLLQTKKECHLLPYTNHFRYLLPVSFVLPETLKDATRQAERQGISSSAEKLDFAWVDAAEVLEKITPTKVSLLKDITGEITMGSGTRKARKLNAHFVQELQDPYVRTALQKLIDSVK